MEMLSGSDIDVQNKDHFGPLNRSAIHNISLPLSTFSSISSREWAKMKIPLLPTHILILLAINIEIF